MTLKGDYSATATYNVGDVVRYTDGVVYIAQKAAPAGATPKDTAFWGKLNQTLAGAVGLILDAEDTVLDEVDDAYLAQDHVYNGLSQTSSGYALDARQGKTLKTSVDTNTTDITNLKKVVTSETKLTLKTETGVYELTIDDSGESPVLDITDVTPEPEEEEEGDT